MSLTDLILGRETRKELLEKLQRQEERANRYDNLLSQLIDENNRQFKRLLDARYHAESAMWEDI